MNNQVRQQQALEEEQRRLMKEAKKAARQLRRSQKRTDKARALNAARQTGYSGTIIMLNGKPYEVVYESRPAQVVDSRNMAPPSYNTAPAPRYTTETVNGIPILKIFRGYNGELYAVGRMGTGTDGLIWGRRYNPETGMWQGGDYNLTSKQIDELSYGMEIVVNNGNYGTSVTKSSNVRKGNKNARRRTSPPKNPTTSSNGKKKGKGAGTASRNSKKSPSKNTKNSTANRAANGSRNAKGKPGAGKC